MINKLSEEPKKGSIVIYKTSEGRTKLEVKLEKDTVWLTQNQIAILFGTQRPAITKHLNNIIKSGELNRKSVSSILEHTTLTALSLLIAISNPKEKDVMIKIITNLIK